MPTFPSRRRILATSAGAALAVGAMSRTASAATPSASEETRGLDELYRAAKAEGGKLVIYAGGDTPSQQDATKAAFTQAFPDIDLTIVVDYSKYHDVRIDNQLATDTLVPDVVQLQTLQDFTRWKAQGHLLPYRPAGFSKLYDAFRDPQGAWTALSVISFGFMYGTDAVGSHAPRTPLDLLDPRWKGRIASSYPHDDDAVLYLYSLYVRKYGWEWAARFAAQDVAFARGSNSPGDALRSGAKAIGVGGAGAPLGTGPVRWVLPDAAPFMAWGQRAAILRKAAHPTAAKLYLNWSLSTARQQQAFNGWSVRTDVTPPTGLKPVWRYPQANLDGFPRFMADRAEIERLKQTFALYFGEVRGEPTPGWPGLHPGA
ncbi:extracellular solute-binding protein [Streptomyces sp. NPDC004539]|uniref:ABC transporter substrate-binding protein n=1 Tax=Streptomyces sp. NPDC004539 TaxID=3154280 RepID=UPI0033BDBB7D